MMKPVDHQKRFEHVENWHVISATSVAHVGSPERLLIVDESPSRRSKILAGNRLADLFGFRDREELLEHVDAITLLPTWPGTRKSCQNVLFPMGQARREREKLHFAAEGIVLLGRVGKVCGFGHQALATGLLQGARAITLPRMNAFWWNDRDNVKAARKALEPWATFALTGRWPR